ncbi:lactate utilization protein [Candidatus Sumerlaeota bacterium]|nr:lactate utilization protein [Candidatus Sumerlaeota bacterium]
MTGDSGSFIAGLKTELEKLPGRPPKGELLRRAKSIPLVWPPTEYPESRSMAQQFQNALLPWGGKVHLLKENAEVLPLAGKLIQEAGAKRITRWFSERLDAFDWERGLAPLGLEWIIPSEEELSLAAEEEKKRETMIRLEKVEVGITDCDWAIAHTGSLVVRHSPRRNGYANLFPWTNIALVWTSQLLRTVQEAVETLGADQAGKPWPPNTVFISGPSRSGDIDLTVGQGAAGPGNFHVLLIEN